MCWLLKHIEAEANGHHFPDDIFEMNFFEWNVWIWMQMSLKFVPRVQLTISHIVSVGRPGDKPSSETMMVSLLTQICITQSQWAIYVTQYCHRSSTKASPLLIKATYIRSYMRVTAHQNWTTTRKAHTARIWHLSKDRSGPCVHVAIVVILT